jgi:hypothetical protein
MVSECLGELRAIAGAGLDTIGVLIAPVGRPRQARPEHAARRA